MMNAPLTEALSTAGGSIGLPKNKETNRTFRLNALRYFLRKFTLKTSSHFEIKNYGVVCIA